MRFVAFEVVGVNAAKLSQGKSRLTYLLSGLAGQLHYRMVESLYVMLGWFSLYAMDVAVKLISFTRKRGYDIHGLVIAWIYFLCYLKGGR